MPLAPYFTKRHIAEIARKIWPHGERAEGRETVRAVLTTAGLNVQPKRRNALDKAAAKYYRRKPKPQKPAITLRELRKHYV